VLNLDEDQGPAIFHDLGYNGWWAATSTIKDKPQVVARFVKAMQDAYCWYSNPDNLDRTVAIMQNHAKVPDLTDAEYKAMVQRILPSYGLAITTRTIDTWAELLTQEKLLHTHETRSDVIAQIGQQDVACPH
jgi:ABC-type nitrate/sulfonate/bicarbonate transport system substrate-binding protein